MKFCNQCGAELEDDMLFCASCGAKQTDLTQVVEETPVEAPETPVEIPAEVSEAAAETVAAVESAAAEAEANPFEPEPVAVTEPPVPPKKSKKGLLIGIIAAAAAVIAVVAGILVFFNLKKETIDASKLVKVVGYGPDGYGKVAVLVANEKTMHSALYDPDEEAFPGLWSYLYDMTGQDEETYPEGVLSWISSNTSDYFRGTKAWKSLSNEDKISEAKSALKKLKVSVEDDGKNGNYGVGDTITIIVKADEDDLKKAHVKFTGTKFEYTFTEEDFAPCKKVDPFQGFTCTFEGYEGNPEIKYDFETIDAEVKNLFYYSLDYDQYYDAKNNGDVITFIANPYGDLSKGYLIRDGKYYTCTEDQLKKAVTVSGLKELKNIDLFEGIQFTYSGYAPSLGLEVDKSGLHEAIRDHIEYRLSKSSKLNIGETITITARVGYSDKKALNEAGYTFDEEKMTFEYTIPANAPHILTAFEDGINYNPEELFGLRTEFEQFVGTQYIPGYIDAGGEVSAINDIQYLSKELFAATDEYGNARNEFWQVAKVDFTAGGAAKTIYLLCKAYDVYADQNNALQKGGNFEGIYYATEEEVNNEIQKKKNP